MKQVLWIIAAILLLSCTGRQSKPPVGDIFDESNISAGERMILDAQDAHDYKRMIILADSLGETGDISKVAAHYYHGGGAVNRGMLKEAQEQLKEATVNDTPDAADMRLYLRAKGLLARVLSTEGDFEGALKEAIPTLTMMDSLGNKDFGDLTQLNIVIGDCQQNLHMSDDAAVSYDKAYTLLQQWMNADTTGTDMPRIIIRMDNISSSYINTSEYAKAKIWLEREDSALAIYNTKPDVIEKQADLLKGSIQLDLAETCQRLGLSEEAARHYDEHRQTNFSTRHIALITACDYLLAAGRYAEAADNYSHLDYIFEKRDLDLSLDNIGHYLLPKMRANVLAGRKDSAIAASMQIYECFDSALTSKKEEAAAELATVYDTQGKERKIAEQQMRLSRARVLALVVTIIALTVFFVIFHIIRQRAAKRLAKVNAAKERMEGELSVARDIQKSMVPSTFPDYEGLDMYASMTPAREVGGDLYSFLQKDDILYFCIGDVSGKGVPASLFMTQATRLFRTLASQDMDPAEIATHMNAELAEDNEQGMFVTMFICRLNMKLHLLEYCNAGHNPPVLGNTDGQFSFLDMDEANAPIGLWPGLEYEGETIDYFKDRMLLLYTDGLNEAENAYQEQFGEERIINILTSKPSANAQGIIEALEEEVALFRDGAEPNDDLTMLCLSLTI